MDLDLVTVTYYMTENGMKASYTNDALQMKASHTVDALKCLFPIRPVRRTKPIPP